MKLFKHIKDNQIFYKTYFKLELDKSFIIEEYDYTLSSFYYDDGYLDYHIDFFRAGINAVIKRWLGEGCKESLKRYLKLLKVNIENRGCVLLYLFFA